jgi:hypothetical protein
VRGLNQLWGFGELFYRVLSILLPWREIQRIIDNSAEPVVRLALEISQG